MNVMRFIAPCAAHVPAGTPHHARRLARITLADARASPWRRSRTMVEALRYEMDVCASCVVRTEHGARGEAPRVSAFPWTAWSGTSFAIIARCSE